MGKFSKKEQKSIHFWLLIKTTHFNGYETGRKANKNLIGFQHECRGAHKTERRFAKENTNNLALIPCRLTPGVRNSTKKTKWNSKFNTVPFKNSFQALVICLASYLLCDILTLLVTRTGASYTQVLVTDKFEIIALFERTLILKRANLIVNIRQSVSKHLIAKT